MSLDDDKERLIAALDDWYEPIDPCAHGHLDHTSEAHRGPRIVHAFAGTLGADWDYDSAVAFIRAAEWVELVEPRLALFGHGGRVRSGGRAIAFATKKGPT